MTAYNLTIGSVKQPLAAAAPAMFRLTRVIDFAETPYVSGDVLSIFNIAQGISVLAAGTKLLRAEGAASTSHTVGDTGSANQWIATVNANDTVGTTLAAISGWEHYNAANFVKFTLGADISNAKILFTALCWDVGCDFSTET